MVNFVVSLAGALTATLSRRDHILKRLGAGCAGAILLLSGVVLVITTYRSHQTRQRTVFLQVEEKNEVVRNCDRPGGTCTDYVVEGNTGGVHFTFGLGKDGWDGIEVKADYVFTYYPPKSLLGDCMNRLAVFSGSKG